MRLSAVIAVILIYEKNFIPAHYNGPCVYCMRKNAGATHYSRL